MSIPLSLLLCVTMTVTPYAPSLGGINGDLVTANGTRLTPEHHFRTAACGPRYPFGTRFVIRSFRGTGEDLEVQCNDRGGMIGNLNLDVLVFTGDGPKEDWRVAKAIGKTRHTVCEIKEDE